MENLLDLAAAIEAELDAVGRRAWADEECAALLARPHGAPDPDRSWWKLRDARQLRGSARGVAQEVAAWREQRAQVVDLPIRTVLPDLALQAIAHRPPIVARGPAASAGPGRPAAALRRGRRASGRGRKGRTLPEADLRLPPADDVPKELRAAVALLLAWVAQLARDQRLDAAVLATRADLAAYLRGDADARLATGWRAGDGGRADSSPGRRPTPPWRSTAAAHLVLEERSSPALRDRPPVTASVVRAAVARRPVRSDQGAGGRGCPPEPAEARGGDAGRPSG